MTQKLYCGYYSAIFLAIFLPVSGSLGYVGMQILDVTNATFDLSDRSNKSQTRFASKMIDPVLQDVVRGNIKNPVIKARHRELLSLIKQNLTEVKVVYSMVSMGKNIAAGSSISDGVGYINIDVQSQMDLYLLLPGSDPKAKKETFENSLLIAGMHELEHLAVDSAIAKYFEGAAALMNNEDAIWARTCKFTLAPLRSEGKNISYYAEYYNAWLQFLKPEGFDTNWTGFIGGKYAEQHPFKKFAF